MPSEEPTIEEKVEGSKQNLDQTVRILTELRDHLESERDALVSLQDEVEERRQYLQVTAEDAENIGKILHDRASKVATEAAENAERREREQQKKSQRREWIFFGLGALTSLATSLFFYWLSL
ncbi:hypothetical protein [Glycomyces harbinensis]|uniref:hypothetical protein n=1 Tax=Glycomyces harbinensis TaxID=58114 RepID=UPI0015A607B6|nr:hypothetical protein [Glycomyces harbinensis]